MTHRHASPASIFCFLTVLAALVGTGCAPQASSQAQAASPKQGEHMEWDEEYERIEVSRSLRPSPYFVKEGKPFCFLGSNNYYPMYQSNLAVLDLLDAAQAMNLGVLRIWAFLDRGSLDGSVPNIREPGHKDGVYFQYWDPLTQSPAYNDGPDGLQRLDFVLHEARKRGLMLTLVLTNNWRDFGGMDQYLSWYGLKKHHEFFSDQRVRTAYKNWVQHLVSRVNSIDGIPYVDDPAIFAWELANEARAVNYEDFDSLKGWDARTITDWAFEMSSWIKSLDKNHMVAMGDEGFINAEGDQVFKNSSEHEFYQAAYGIDNEALTSLPHIDFGTYHLYPDHWKVGHTWSNRWVEDHIEIGRRVDKPMILEEYGIRVRRADEISGPIVQGWQRREVAYSNWNDIVLNQGGAASMFWILSGRQSEERLYPDYDHFTVYRDDATYRLLKAYSDRFRVEAQACESAEGLDHGPVSAFVSTRRALRPDRLGNSELGSRVR